MLNAFGGRELDDAFLASLRVTETTKSGDESYIVSLHKRGKG